jgi:hypothetical protein
MSYRFIVDAKMTRYLVAAFLFVVVLAIYGLNRGIFVGSARYVYGTKGYPESDTIKKRCRYLFVTGVSEIDARDGEVSAPSAGRDQSAFLDAIKKPENGYCPLFGE